MRFVVVLVDATEEEAIEFIEVKISPQEPAELLFVNELTETAALVRKEVINKREIDAIFFVSSNLNLVPLIFQAGEELRSDPLTRGIAWMTLLGQQACDVVYMSEKVPPGVPQSLLDMLMRKRGAPKQPN